VQISTVNLLLSLKQTHTVVGPSASKPVTDIPALTAGIRAGNEEAFRQFHALYFDRLYQFQLIVARGNEDEARDALQETLLRVVRYARRFEREEVFWSWLKAIARSAARDGGRKQNRYLGLLRNFTLHWQNSSQSSPAHTEPQLADFLEEALEELNPDERSILEGKYLQGFTVKELASDTGLTEKAVESRLLRLRRQIREAILKKLRAS
jgi:RNA polymerase sigma-70 factor (ECF subfamily)